MSASKTLVPAMSAAMGGTIATQAVCTTCKKSARPAVRRRKKPVAKKRATTRRRKTTTRKRRSTKKKKPAYLVKGSRAAKMRMAKLRKMRR